MDDATTDATKLERLNVYIKAYIEATEAKNRDDQKHAIVLMIFVINWYKIDKTVVVNALTENNILEEIREFIKARPSMIDMPEALLSGGNRRTKRTTHRKMRKSLIRRRR
jgi:hypothetical protein